MVGCAIGLMEVARPARLEIFEIVAFDHLVWSGAVVVAVDAEGFKQAGQVFGAHGFAFVPLVPVAVIQGVKEGYEIGGGDPLGIAFGGEGVAEVGEDLPGAVEVFEGG